MLIFYIYIFVIFYICYFLYLFVYIFIIIKKPNGACQTASFIKIYETNLAELNQFKNISNKRKLNKDKDKELEPATKKRRIQWKLIYFKNKLTEKYWLKYVYIDILFLVYCLKLNNFFFFGIIIDYFSILYSFLIGYLILKINYIIVISCKNTHI